MAEHPITPPPELLHQWATEYWGNPGNSIGESEKYIAIQAARWGADQELEACVELWANNSIKWTSSQLRDDRRPKPPSLKEQALEELDLIPTHDNEGRPVGVDVSIIRRALEALPE